MLVSIETGWAHRSTFGQIPNVAWTFWKIGTSCDFLPFGGYLTSTERCLSFRGHLRSTLDLPHVRRQATLGCSARWDSASGRLEKTKYKKIKKCSFRAIVQITVTAACLVPMISTITALWSASRPSFDNSRILSAARFRERQRDSVAVSNRTISRGYAVLHEDEHCENFVQLELRMGANPDNSHDCCSPMICEVAFLETSNVVRFCNCRTDFWIVFKRSSNARRLHNLSYR